MMPLNKVHRNIPQQLFYIIQCKINVLIWGRGTGKTSGPGADFSLTNILKMPRSNGGIYCNSYSDLLVKVLPALVEGWSQHGYKENYHYFIGKFAPDHYNWPKAYRHPISPKHYVHWFNGSGNHLVSGDHSITNGNNIDWGLIDEARLQNQQKLREFLLTLRGGANYFGKLSCHHSVLYLTDMPRHSKEKWLLDFREKMDPKVIEMIMLIQYQINSIYEKYENADAKLKPQIEKELNYFIRALDKLRSSTVYFSTATTFDNIHALGLDPIKNFLSILSEVDFLISVLNRNIIKVEKGFYPLLDEDKHGYFADDVHYIDSLGIQYDIANAYKYERTSLWDMDVDPDQPLDIAADYNNLINSVGTLQLIGNEYRILNSQFVLAPMFLKDLALLWCKYYQHHRNKQVNYIYDNTAIAGNARGDVSFADDWVYILEGQGWKVNRQYIGQAPLHDTRYKEWHDLLDEKDGAKMPFKIRFNRKNAGQWFISASQAGVKQSEGKFKKDKQSERDNKIKPEDSTHISEAIDQAVYYKYQSMRVGNNERLVTTIM